MNGRAESANRIAVSLIIPTYGREGLLVNTLRCALAQDRDDCEIIVVDQTPSHEPATREFLHDNASRIRLVELSRPSLTAARNAGLREARGDVVVFVDDDTTFEPDFLTRHLEAHGPGTGAVQGRVTEPSGIEHAQPPWLNRWLRFSGGNNCDHDGSTNCLTGCNFSVCREVLDTVGFFDERFVGVAVREETDFAMRVIAAGFRIRFCAGAAVFHHRSNSGGVGEGGNALFFNRLYYFNEMLFATKHFSPLAVALYRVRLRLRGRRALKRLIRHAESEARRALGDG